MGKGDPNEVDCKCKDFADTASLPSHPRVDLAQIEHQYATDLAHDNLAGLVNLRTWRGE